MHYRAYLPKALLPEKLVPIFHKNGTVIGYATNYLGAETIISALHAIGYDRETESAD